MKWLVRIVGVIVALVVVLALVAFLLPRQVAVERSVVVDAPPEEVWPHVNSMQAMQAWSPWLERDPDVQVNFDGPETGVGNRMSWTSEQRDVGSGTQEITAVEENQRVETALDFGDMGTADAVILLEPEGDGTKVTWGFETDMGGNPVGRWMGLMMDGWVGGDYEAGLGKLKALVEG